MAFSQGENLFLGEEGWQAPYIPAMIKREPFLIGFGHSAPGANDRARMLSLDMEHPRVNTEVGEPLFQPLGGRTEFLENAANLLETIYTGIDHTKAFCAALVEHDLIEAVTFEIELKDASRNQLVGFHCIAEEKAAGALRRDPGRIQRARVPDAGVHGAGVAGACAGPGRTQEPHAGC